MNRFRLIAFALMAAFVLPVSARSQTPTAGKPERGKLLYRKYGCYECHGYDGHGGAGAKLAPHALPAAALIAYVRHPAPGGMPVYSSKVLSDGELMDIWAFLKAIPDSPAAKDIPLLNPK